MEGCKTMNTSNVKNSLDHSNICSDNLSSKSSHLKQATKQFIHATSVKGLSKAAKSEHFFVKILWMTGTLFGLAVAIFLVSQLTIAYFDYETVIEIEKCATCTPDFPDITICNLNVIGSFDLVPDLMTFDSYVNMTKTKLREADHDITGEQRAVLEEMFSTAAYFSNLYLNIDPLFEYLFSPGGRNILIHDCAWYDWSGRELPDDCSFAGLTHIQGGEMGMCYTIQTEQLATKQVSAVNAILYLHDFIEDQPSLYRYTPLQDPTVRGSRGARIYIHESGTFPMVTKGFDIEPGTDAVVNLELQKNQRIPKPYGECTDRKQLDGLAMSQNCDFKPKYTLDAGIARCQQLHTISQCNCLNPYLPVTPGIYTEYYEQRGILPCLTIMGTYPQLNVTEMFTRIECFRTLSFEGHCDDFLNPCEENAYSFELFTTSWPHKSYELSFYNEVINVTDDPRSNKFEDRFSVYDNISLVFNENRVDGLRMLRDENLIEDNFIQLNVRFQTTGITHQTMKPAFTYQYLIGNYGGVLNLWIGITLFTLLEIVELIYHCCYICISKRKEKIAPA